MNPQSDLLPPHAHGRKSSRSGSISSSSVVTVKRSASLSLAAPDAHLPDPSTKPHPRATPPPAQARRRSSAANGAAEGIGAERDHQASGTLSTTNGNSLVNGAAPHPVSPPRTASRTQAASRSPTSSPRARPRSPVYDSSSSSSLQAVTAAPAPRKPSLGPVLLPSSVYDPNTPTSASTTNSPSASSLFTPTLITGYQQRDYFNSKPAPVPQPQTQRPPSRTHVDKVLGKSPLGSPGPHDADARYEVTPGSARPSTVRPPSVAAAATRDSAQKPPPTVGHRQIASRDHSRTQSREQFRSASRTQARSPTREHLRTESNASARLEDGYQGTPPRTRERREKDKKTMLSRALQKANTAVLLDNAQNFEGAMEAYEDACKLLQQVMIRSSQEEDRRKLDAIRVTYTNRIEELRRLDPSYTNNSGKSLPARPMSGESLDEHRSMLMLDDDEPAVIHTASVSRIVNDPSVYDNPEPEKRAPSQQSLQSQQLPFRKGLESPRESVISTAIRDVQRGLQTPQFNLQPPPGRLAPSASSARSSAAESAMDRMYMPPPLSPNRSKSPLLTSKSDHESNEPSRLLQPEQAAQGTHRRVQSNESTSWLDTIDESGGSSCSSSVHSLSPEGVRRKHLRNPSGGTEAEFDAALDAAVEAAYDDGYEPYDDDLSTPGDLIATKLRNVELAKERVREAEREEAILAARYRYKETQLRNDALPHVRESAEMRFNDEADEEERLLDEMTREYMLDGFDFDLQTKSSLPRQSDSSGFSGSTYNSSVSSHRTTGGTSLSTVAEVIHPPSKQPPVHSPPAIPAPLGALPALPPVPETQAAQTIDTAEITPRPTTATKDSASVRSRRLSGQNAKQLKIETSVQPVPPAPHTEKPPVPPKEVPTDLPPQPKSAAASFNTTKPILPALSQVSQQAGLSAPSPQPTLYSPAETIATVSPATPALSYAASNDPGLVPGSPKTGKTSALGIRKNKSSLSLKQRNLSISSPDGSDVSIGTPLSTTFSITGRKPSNAGLPLPTPSLPTFNVDGLPSGGMHLFESDIHSPFSPGSPSPAITNAPIPLEPCPDSYLLRPFWLMRCFYQTIAHPRGGYLSTKLFIPRDVWRVKGVKLKNVEDKIANCDMLTAALQKLAAVDMNDADAVLDEMNSLETILDQIQTVLAKKLGNEVGLQSVTALFKDATTVGEGAASTDGFGKGSHGSQEAPRGAVAQGKSYLASWRKLRSKNSGVNLAGMAGGAKNPEVPKDTLVMATLPMTNLPTIRFAKRDISGVVFEGPNAGYMGSLARLFDAVQVLDQIARQVEDPGLKHSSPTHVGLELSARHAAEFFGFYICRFVLTDVMLMLDKFIKRGSEWVLV
ncbi:MIT protein [Pyrenophora tritici-repentis]|nr:MIT multi-domain protein [Pyrenophora tritici-repentis]KAF7454914.1 MIT multi-domain protein [Pyrenophora tritici-repentis]KAG9388672.1 MIT multi-domain protein [Pyrenophora tritici-repentis]KAI0584472.1 MIT multi-domain protein [Pyrenophora tritici-repentis]KAI0586061.1 MIT multi-domain protein [Pyrenophora tritici-repentis]